MTKTSTKKRANKKTPATALATAAVTKKSSTSKPQKKTRKKNVSHQQTIQVWDMLDAEYHDWHTSVSQFHTFFPLPLQPYCSSAPTCILYIYRLVPRCALSRLMASLADNNGSATS